MGSTQCSSKPDNHNNMHPQHIYTPQDLCSSQNMQINQNGTITNIIIILVGNIGDLSSFGIRKYRSREMLMTNNGQQKREKQKIDELVDEIGKCNGRVSCFDTFSYGKIVQIMIISIEQHNKQWIDISAYRNILQYCSTLNYPQYILIAIDKSIHIQPEQLQQSLQNILQLYPCYNNKIFLTLIPPHKSINNLTITSYSTNLGILQQYCQIGKKYNMIYYPLKYRNKYQFQQIIRKIYAWQSNKYDKVQYKLQIKHMLNTLSTIKLKLVQLQKQNEHGLGTIQKQWKYIIQQIYTIIADIIILLQRRLKYIHTYPDRLIIYQQIYKIQQKINQIQAVISIFSQGKQQNNQQQQDKQQMISNNTSQHKYKQKCQQLYKIKDKLVENLGQLNKQKQNKYKQKRDIIKQTFDKLQELQKNYQVVEIFRQQIQRQVQQVQQQYMEQNISNVKKQPWQIQFEQRVKNRIKLQSRKICEFRAIINENVELLDKLQHQEGKKVKNFKNITHKSEQDKLNPLMILIDFYLNEKSKVITSSQKDKNQLKQVKNKPLIITKLDCNLHSILQIKPNQTQKQHLNCHQQVSKFHQQKQLNMQDQMIQKQKQEYICIQLQSRIQQNIKIIKNSISQHVSSLQNIEYLRFSEKVLQNNLKIFISNQKYQ